MQSSPPETHVAKSSPPSARPSPVTSEDQAFADALRAVGLAPDLVGEELVRVARAARPTPGIERTIDLVEAYYEGGGEEAVSQARRSVDRYLCQRAGDAIGTTALLNHLGALAPELGEIALERIGGGDEGPLVLRAGEHFAALLDDYEENLETGEIDLRDIETARQGQAVTLRGLVRALNALLERFSVRERMVPLRSDADREIYVALPLTEALELARGGHLEEENAEDVMELGCW
jgi:hypothetical protein